MFYSLIDGITSKICMLCFVLINSVLSNLSCVWKALGLKVFAGIKRGKRLANN